MSKKQPKIKRYSSSMGKGYQKKRALTKTFGLFIAFAVLLGGGYFVAPYVIGSVGSFWQKFSAPITVEPTPVIPGDSSSITETIPAPEQTPGIRQNLIYCEVSPEELSTKEKIQAMATKLKGKNVTTAVITLKDAAGNLFFQSNTVIGKESIGKTVISLPLVTEIFTENGIASCANLYTFMDKTAPNIDRSIAVKYIGTDYTWLDSAKELGGKPWANPASPIMQQYMYDITDEILSAGFKEIIFSAVQLPTGHSLDKREFGVTNDQLLAQIKGFITSVQTRVSSFGARASFAFSFESVTGGDYKQYIDVPNRLGAENIILTCELSAMGDTDIAELSSRLKTNDNIEMLSIWLSDAELPAPPKELSGYFVKV